MPFSHTSLLHLLQQHQYSGQLSAAKVVWYPAIFLLYWFQAPVKSSFFHMFLRAAACVNFLKSEKIQSPVATYFRAEEKGLLLFLFLFLMKLSISEPASHPSNLLLVDQCIKNHTCIWPAYDVIYSPPISRSHKPFFAKPDINSDCKTMCCFSLVLFYINCFPFTIGLCLPFYIFCSWGQSPGSFLFLQSVKCLMGITISLVNNY